MHRPRRRLAFAVACVAAASLLLEISLTRIFSVVLLYHYSFFAVALAMAGLALGGLWMAGRPLAGASDGEFHARLAGLAFTGATSCLAGLGVLIAVPENGEQMLLVCPTLVFLVSFTAAGAFLAGAFARNPSWIETLYASDLLAAATGCLAAIWVLRRVQGPLALVVPPLLLLAAATALAPRGMRRAVNLTLAAVLGVVVVVAAARDGPLLRLRGSVRPGTVVFERWNDYSRVQGVVGGSSPDTTWFVIDRVAATPMYRIPPAPGGGPPPGAHWWGGAFQGLAYYSGRPLERVAVIGVGGGPDLLPGLWRGARAVVGFDLNQTFIDLLQRDAAAYNAVARRPEVRLVNAEARTALRQERDRFDLIQASLIDTWAATAAGGFVLAENGLYTLDGWRVLLDRLTPAGVLTMTRWYLPRAPAEMRRLVALGATALAEAGVPDARGHLILAVTKPAEGRMDPALGPVLLATIVVSRAPFTTAELERLRSAPISEPFEIIADPTRPAADSVVDALLSRDRRAAAIAASPFDISPPTDDRPYFFLQLRASDLPHLIDRSIQGPVTEVTFNGLRVLMLLVLWAVVFAGAVWWAGGRSAVAGRRLAGSRALRGYFLGIGLGYMLVQLGLHQRLTLLLGHPTYALSIVLFAMLLGTGLGAALAQRLALPGDESRAWATLLGAVAATVLALPALPLTDAFSAAWARHLAVAAPVAAVGAALGTAFPIGVRLAARYGPSTVQRMWAVNGAASIAGTAIAALIGVVGGSRAVVAAGLVCYLGAVASGWRVLRLEDAIPARAQGHGPPPS